MLEDGAGNPMDADLFVALLLEDEGTALDFKQAQYPFGGASDEQKAELLKDLLAFANSWRRTDAYVLIGVKEVKGGRSIPVGVNDHLNDADLQQFVNSKTQRPLTFAYHAHAADGVPVGVLWVPLQQRPVFLTKPFGRLAANTVYVRRGSSTDIATPDEIAEMGRTPLGLRADKPSVRVEFANLDSREGMGQALSLTSTVIAISAGVRFIKTPRPGYSGMLVNEDYVSDLANWFRLTKPLTQLGFLAENTSGTAAHGVHVEMEFGAQDYLFVFDEEDLPEKPKWDLVTGIARDALLRVPTPDVRAKQHGKQWHLRFDVGDLRPKARAWSQCTVWIGATADLSLATTAKVYADSLPEPIEIPLSLEIQAQKRDLRDEDLEGYIRADTYGNYR